MNDFIEAIAQSSNATKELAKTKEFIDGLFSVDKNESDEAIVITKGSCQIRLTDKQIEISHDRLLSTKITIKQGDIELKWRDGTTLNMSDVSLMKEMYFRQQSSGGGGSAPTVINPQLPITYNSTSGNLGINLNPISPLSFNPVNGNLAIAINAQSPLSFNPVNGNLAINFNPQAPLSFNSSTGNLSIGVFPSLTITAPNTSTVPLTINSLNSGANNLEVRRQDNSVGFLIYNSGSLEVMSGSFYRHSGNQVLGGRVTGWAAMTGTATRSAYATSSVTLSQLAERVKALIDDLRSHGLIGN